MIKKIRFVCFILICIISIGSAAAIPSSASMDMNQVEIFYPSIERIDKYDADVTVIDKKTAFAYGGVQKNFGTVIPGFKKYDDYLTSIRGAEFLPTSVDKGMIFSLLSAGSPLDVLDLRKKHSVGEWESYDITQKALWVVMGDKSYEEMEQALTTENEKAYLNELISTGYEQRNYEVKINFSPETVSFSKTKDGYTSGPITGNSILGGVFKITNLPEGYAVYDEKGEAISDIPIGIKFIIKAKVGSFEKPEFNIEYTHKVPQIYYYDYIHGTGSGNSSDYKDIITVDFSTENIGIENQVLSSIYNPETYDSNLNVSVSIFIISSACLLILLQKKVKS